MYSVDLVEYGAMGPPLEGCRLQQVSGVIVQCSPEEGIQYGAMGVRLHSLYKMYMVTAANIRSVKEVAQITPG